MGLQFRLWDEKVNETYWAFQCNCYGTASNIIKDTEFPGIFVSREESQRFRSEEEQEYSHIRRNVEETKLIQIGLTIADNDGNVPEPVCTWQFNFKFDIQK